MSILIIANFLQDVCATSFPFSHHTLVKFSLETPSKAPPAHTAHEAARPIHPGDTQHHSLPTVAVSFPSRHASSTTTKPCPSRQSK